MKSLKQMNDEINESVKTAPEADIKIEEENLSGISANDMVVKWTEDVYGKIFGFMKTLCETDIDRKPEMVPYFQALMNTILSGIRYQAPVVTMLLNMPAYCVAPDDCVKHIFLIVYGKDSDENHVIKQFYETAFCLYPASIYFSYKHDKKLQEILNAE